MRGDPRGGILAVFQRASLLYTIIRTLSIGKMPKIQNISLILWISLDFSLIFSLSRLSFHFLKIPLRICVSETNRSLAAGPTAVMLKARSRSQAKFHKHTPLFAAFEQ